MEKNCCYYVCVGDPTEYPQGVLTWTSSCDCTCIPEGYELIETEEHKKQRYEGEIEAMEKMLKYYGEQGAQTAEDLEKTKKSLESMK